MSGQTKIGSHCGVGRALSLLWLSGPVFDQKRSCSRDHYYANCLGVDSDFGETRSGKSGCGGGEERELQ